MGKFWSRPLKQLMIYLTACVGIFAVLGHFLWERQERLQSQRYRQLYAEVVGNVMAHYPHA